MHTRNLIGLTEASAKAMTATLMRTGGGEAAAPVPGLTPGPRLSDADAHAPSPSAVGLLTPSRLSAAAASGGSPRLARELSPAATVAASTVGSRRVRGPTFGVPNAASNSFAGAAVHAQLTAGVLGGGGFIAQAASPVASPLSPPPRAVFNRGPMLEARGAVADSRLRRTPTQITGARPFSQSPATRSQTAAVDLSRLGAGMWSSSAAGPASPLTAGRMHGLSDVRGVSALRPTLRGV